MVLAVQIVDGVVIAEKVESAGLVIVAAGMILVESAACVALA